MFYVEKDEKIVLFNAKKELIETTMKFMPQYAGLEIKETDRPIENFEWADTPEYIAKKKVEELEQKIAGLEAKTGLIRALRENVLAEGSVYSDYVKATAKEIEDLAQELRAAQASAQSQKPELDPLED